MVACICQYAKKNHYTAYLKWVSCMVCELYLRKLILKENITLGSFTEMVTPHFLGQNSFWRSGSAHSSPSRSLQPFSPTPLCIQVGHSQKKGFSAVQRHPDGKYILSSPLAASDQQEASLPSSRWEVT